MKRKIENKIKRYAKKKKCEIKYMERYIKTIYKDIQIKIQMK